jgi:hypothetical protein
MQALLPKFKSQDRHSRRRRPARGEWWKSPLPDCSYPTFDKERIPGQWLYRFNGAFRADGDLQLDSAADLHLPGEHRYRRGRLFDCRAFRLLFRYLDGSLAIVDEAESGEDCRESHSHYSVHAPPETEGPAKSRELTTSRFAASS